MSFWNAIELVTYSTIFVTVMTTATRALEAIVIV